MFTQQLNRSPVSKNVHSKVGMFSHQQECPLNNWNVHSSARMFTQQLESSSSRMFTQQLKCSLMSKNVHSKYVWERNKFGDMYYTDFFYHKRREADIDRVESKDCTEKNGHIALIT
ncbi:hypothetical protein Hdeb2414_s0022g00616851 [Helianthus debilis subsp. tardiflorus]